MKEHILDEIQRTARENGGFPLGIGRFQSETGITRNDWFPYLWTKWADAQREAGYEPTRLQGKLDDEYVLQALISLIRDLGRVPVNAELRIAAKESSGFPSHTRIGKLGTKQERLRRVIEFCKQVGDHDDVIEMCSIELEDVPLVADADAEWGYVYLFKMGKDYKLGATNSVGRRQYELSIKMPKELVQVHAIKTDDPFGIEAYWQKRFSSKHLRGEWFSLSPSDVAAFRRRNFM